jgi:hypothetical protein
MRILVHYSHAIHSTIINALNNAFKEVFQHVKWVNAEIMRMKRVFNAHFGALFASIRVNYALFTK